MPPKYQATTEQVSGSFSESDSDSSDDSSNEYDSGAREQARRKREIIRREREERRKQMKRDRFKLYDYQEIHIDYMADKLFGFELEDGNRVVEAAYPFVADTSTMGTGKTVTTLHFCARHKIRFFIVTYGSLEQKPWLYHIKEMGMEDYFLGFISINSNLLGSPNQRVSYPFHFKEEIDGKVMKKSLLVRENKEVEFFDAQGDAQTKIEPHFSLAKERRGKKNETVAGRIFGEPPEGANYNCTAIIYDEYHGLKNSGSLRNKAVRPINNFIFKLNKPWAKMLFLSATPIDKKEQGRGMAYAMGFTAKPALTKGSNEKEKDPLQIGGYGLIEIFRECLDERFAIHEVDEIQFDGTTERVPIDLTKSLAKQYNFLRSNNYKNYDVKKTTDFVYDLMNEVVFPKVTVAMPPVTVSQRAYRGFFPVSEDGLPSVLMGLDELGEIKKMVDEVDEARDNDSKKEDNKAIFAKITLALMKIEAGLIQDMCEFVWSKLRKNKLHKGILSINYISSVELAANFFREKGLKYITISGTNEKGEKTGPEERAKAIEAFQTKDEVRVAIMITQTGAFGISLHDIDTRSTPDPRTWRKRWMVISPSYYMTAIHQAIGRIFRTGQRSVGECYIYYPNIAYDPEEQPVLLDRILESLNRKSKITSQAIFFRNRGLIKFPGDHPRYVKPGWGIDGNMPGGYINEERAQEPVFDKDGNLVTVAVEKRVQNSEGKPIPVIGDDGEIVYEEVAKMKEIETGRLLKNIEDKVEGYEDTDDWFFEVPPDADLQPNWAEIELREALENELKGKSTGSGAASSVPPEASKSRR